MIIFGHPIHRKYTSLIYRTFITIFSTIIFIFLISCSKIDFDPTTSTLKYVITKDDKWKQ